ncbi:FAD-binding oxidoreductase [Streptomyces sp. NPDC091383]|uniref:FAD-binding oxidoreductase n=1 Tax=Streptomyces sp. NPDC091383 TaxID=3365996 RepID=UPI00382979D3
MTESTEAPPVWDALARLVGPEHAVRGGDQAPHRPNTGMFRPRRVRGILRPGTVEQVRQVVVMAGRTGAGPLHPLSTGRNWGLGSHEAADDDTLVLDLGRLARVRDKDLDGGWAVVEPGVTQGALAQELADTGRMLNVTVAAAGTSVVGNALDRGVGLRRQRTDDLLGLEVVLPDGELAHVGWWPGGERATAVYPHGLGPSLLPLFAQSGLGVVTAAAIRLLPRPEALRVVRMTCAPDALAGVVEAVRRWVGQGLVRGVPRLLDPYTGRPYGGGRGEFLLHLCVDGTPAAVAALVDVLTAEAHATGLFTGISHTGPDDPAPLGQETEVLVARGYAGDPDVRDTLFEAKTGHPAADVDERVGMVSFLPMLPFTGAAVVRAHELLEEVSARTGLRAAATLHVLGPELAECVAGVRFERDEAGAAAAHRALDLLYERFTAAGFAPYRLDIAHVDWLDRLSVDPAATRLARRLKTLLDPAGTIAPGRYR